MKSLQLVAQYGALAIPGVGQAVDAGMSECQPTRAPRYDIPNIFSVAGIQAAKLAKYAFEATSDGVDAFQTWANPCGPSQLPADVSNVFEILGAAPDKAVPKGGFKPPAGLKKGGGKGN